MNPALIQIAIQEAPLVIELLRALLKRKDPTAPTPTDAEVIAAWQNSFISSLAKDDAWLNAHPIA